MTDSLVASIPFLGSLVSSSVKELLAAAQTRKSLSVEAKLNSLSGWYRDESLVFVLGAGASAAYGLPDWNTLLQKLLLNTLEGEHDNVNVVAKTFSAVFSPSSLISARYLSNHYQEKHPTSQLAFENAIRDALYDELSVAEHSALLKEIRQYCIAAGKSPNLDSIITYNYDDLLEKCLRDIDVDIPFCPIYSSGMKHQKEELPIYHVHGYLPQTGQITKKNKVILGEDGYHQQYSDMYGWSNLVQINKFKDKNCLFIGLSFSDPNLRRLLDISKKERGDDEIYHYCIKKRHNIDDVNDRLDDLVAKGFLVGEELDIEDSAANLIELVEKFDEKDAESFGVGIYWVEQYDEIPIVLEKLRGNK
ncbi:hypothetical protein BCT10_14225 [Vibrio splendidus]|uniref:SIR2 family protein n=1 Tax=Vibrio splendidus TaxID=29497 RepID=UPI000C8667FE|nr:SIR2 family protein [Vibrio splendidus]PMO44564.1 hypothetical protein BCT10_14225 [Vibrio splendidus]